MREGVRRGREHPLGMGTHQVGVEVDHLRLDPQAEVQAEGVHPLDERSEPVRPGVGVDGPVAEAGVIVAPPAEPAVVEHEPLGARSSGHLGQLGEPVEVMVEVDGLPGVDEHLAQRSWRRPAHEVVHPGRDTVEPGLGPAADQPRRRAGLPRTEHYLTRGEQLAPTQQAVALGRAVGVGLVVAAPRHVDGPHLAAPEPEPGGAGRQEQRGVVAGAAVASGALPGADGPGVALRHAFTDPPPREVEELARPRRHGECRTRGGHVQAVGAGVAHGGARAHQPLRGQLELDRHLAAEVVVAARDGDAGVLPRPRPATQPDRHGPVAEDLDRRCAGVAVGGQRHQSGVAWLVERAVGDPGAMSLGERRDVDVSEALAERPTPVQQHRDTRRGGREHDAHTRRGQVDER